MVERATVGAAAVGLHAESVAFFDTLVQCAWLNRRALCALSQSRMCMCMCAGMCAGVSARAGAPCASGESGRRVWVLYSGWAKRCIHETKNHFAVAHFRAWSRLPAPSTVQGRNNQPSSGDFPRQSRISIYSRVPLSCGEWTLETGQAGGRTTARCRLQRSHAVHGHVC